VTEEFCAEMYDARSDWVLGAHVRLFTTSGEGPETDEQWRVLGEIAKLQDLLRAAVRRCLEERCKMAAVAVGTTDSRPRNPLNKRHRYRDSNPGFRTENSTKTVRSGHLRPCEVL
jgi:hypothetical protein